MKEYRIEVKPWMTLKSSDGFDFMQKFNNDIPMPLVIMYTSGKLEETRGMVKMSLHGDIKQRVITTCMACGRPITNKISQYFGIGPICGGHNYVSPFDTEEELNEAISAYREKLVNTTWTGWVAKSAIKSIQDDFEEEVSLEDLPYLGQQKVSSNKIFARVDKPIRGTDDFSIFVKFDYNPTILTAVKDGIKAGHRFWDPDKKQWEIDYSCLAQLREELSAFEWVVENEEIVPAPIDVDADFKLKTQPMPHQMGGILYGLEHSRFLLGDEQGLGKTKQVIDLAVIRKNAQSFKHCLIIACVNSLKWNWVEEIEKHSNEKCHVLGQYMMPRRKKLAIGSNADKLADLNALGTGAEIDNCYFLITNVESLRNPEIAEKLKELCSNGTIDMIAADETHRVKNLETKQGQGLINLTPDYRIAMTGTPLINNPLDLYAILKWLGYQPYEFKSFKRHFCIYNEWGDVVGYKNIDQLKDQLNSIMLRRLKKEVLPDLPGKIYKTEYVDLTDEQKKLYNQVIDNAVADPNLADIVSSDCQLAIKLRLRQVAEGIGPFNFIKKNPKFDRLEQLVEEAIYSGNKVIVYSNWLEGIKPAFERLQKYNPVLFTGETDDSDRQELIHKFQTDPECKVFCATTGAAGVGITLTAANEVIFLDEPWTDAAKEQAIDRCHRIGTENGVIVHTIMAYGTYDEEVHDIVIGKRELSDRIVDKKDLLKLKVA